jgi:hypothetical protein
MNRARKLHGANRVTMRGRATLRDTLCDSTSPGSEVQSQRELVELKQSSYRKKSQ